MQYHEAVCGGEHVFFVFGVPMVYIVVLSGQALEIVESLPEIEEDWGPCLCVAVCFLLLDF